MLNSLHLKPTNFSLTYVFISVDDTMTAQNNPRQRQMSVSSARTSLGSRYIIKTSTRFYLDPHPCRNHIMVGCLLSKRCELNQALTTLLRRRSYSMHKSIYNQKLHCAAISYDVKLGIRCKHISMPRRPSAHRERLPL